MGSNISNNAKVSHTKLMLYIILSRNSNTFLPWVGSTIYDVGSTYREHRNVLQNIVILLSIYEGRAESRRPIYETLSDLTFPYPHTFITTAAGEETARWRPSHGLHFILVTFQRGHTFEAVIVFTPNTNCGVEASGGQIPATWRPGHTAYCPTVPVCQDGFTSPVTEFICNE